MAVIGVDDRDGIPVVSVAGEIDMTCDEPIRAALTAQFDRRPAGLVLDLTDVGFFGSTGVRLVVEATTWARDQGVAFALASTRRAVLRTLDIALPDGVVDLHPTVPDAIRALRTAGVPVAH
ncbi:STAS domain-containing protein [Saccharothrix lopnurensis]|uniref:Anti-sigma factor antagonist n=1 Tax=Saccharothrix lopnurensis TaxID=1670621 RepID=A0ABW1PDN1_9PSEU